MQTGYLLIVRFKYTKFSTVALNFWSPGHRMDVGCYCVVAGCRSGGLHWSLVLLLTGVLALNQGYRCPPALGAELGPLLTRAGRRWKVSSDLNMPSPPEKSVFSTTEFS